MAHRVSKNSTALEFAVLARQIETKVDSELLSEVHHLKVLNAISDSFFSNGDELIPVGSCVDGSKVTVPGDSGDLDVLVMSNQILLKESLFDYNLRHPAFLCIRLDRKHKTFFHGIVNPRLGKYLPVHVLKQFHKKLFCFGRLIVQKKTSAGISDDGKFFNVTRNSSVGFERNQLDLDKFFLLGYQLPKENLNSELSSVGKPGLGIFKTFFQCIADRFGDQVLRPFFHNEYIQKFYHTVEILAEDEKEKDYVDQSRQELSFNNNLEKGLRKDNTTTTQCENVDLSDLKKIALSQGDIVEVAQINTETDSCHINAEEPCVSQHSQELEGQEKKQDKFDITEQMNYDENNLSFRKFKSADFIPAFKFKGWPRPAEEWIYRKRRWPPKRIMKEVLDVGCQVVAKRPRVLLTEEYSCGNVAKEENDLSFRLSFALCEVVIAKEMSEQQLLCWRILKAYQKCFLKTKSQAITSYHWKNVIFWVSEEFDKSFWDDSHVFDGVQRSLDFMISCLDQRFLPFYFVRRMNLIHGYNDTVITYVLRRVRMIRSSLTLYLKRYLKFQGMSNVESISIDRETVEEVITEKHKANTINEENECFMDFCNIFYKSCLENNESEQFRNDLSKFNTITQAVRKSLDISDDTDKELKYLSHTLIDALENTSRDKDKMKAFTALIKAFENLVKNQLKNEEIQKEIHDRTVTMTLKSVMALLSEFPQFLIGERTHKNAFIEKFCDTSETVRKMTTDFWTRETESEDEKTKGKVNAAISLMETFSTLIPQIKNVVVRNTTDNKKQMNLELD